MLAAPPCVRECCDESTSSFDVVVVVDLRVELRLSSSAAPARAADVDSVGTTRLSALQLYLLHCISFVSSTCGAC